MQQGNRDTRPQPDPTSLTTDALHREIASLKEIVFTRLDGMDKAIEVLDDVQGKVPSETTKEVSHLKELITMRFSERDVRTSQQQGDAKEALAAALKTANSAISKAEETLNKRLDIAEGARQAVEERIRLMMPRSESEGMHKAHTERINSMISSIAANTERRQGMGQNWQTITIVITMIASIASTLYAITRLAGVQ